AVVENLGNVGEGRADARADAAIAAQADHRLDRIAELLGIDIGMVAADHPGILQALHPLRGGGRREPDVPAELRISGTRVLLQELDELPVLVVERGFRFESDGSHVQYRSTVDEPNIC